MRNYISILFKPFSFINEWKRKRRFRKKVQEMMDEDPFIYD